MARYPVYRKRNSGSRRLIVVLVLLGAVSAGGWALFGRGDDDPSTAVKPTAPQDGSTDGSAAPNTDATTRAVTPPPPPGTEQQRAQALRDYEKGMQLKASGASDIEVRSVLSKALLSGHLTGKVETEAVKELTELANRTLLSRRVYDNDAYCTQYTFRSGDILGKVVRRLKLCVSSKGQLRINPGTNAWRIRAGQTLKLLKGPCHAVVYKSRCIMDLYLQREGMEKVFVRRIKVALGTGGITPLGSWTVANRLVHTDYYPAANSPLKKRRIRYGEPDYAFGAKGLWIGLKGADDKTRAMSGYGIHSTNDQASIGKNASEGCIRVGDADIDMVFDLFYEQHNSDRNDNGHILWSTVEIKP